MNTHSLVPVTVTTIYLVNSEDITIDEDGQIEWSPAMEEVGPQFGIAQVGISREALALGADPTLWAWPDH